MWNEVLIPGVPVGTDRTGMREAVGGPAFVFAVVWFVFFRCLPLAYFPLLLPFNRAWPKL